MKEKIIFSFLFLVVLGSFLAWAGVLYWRFTYSIPHQGGTYTEGAIGQPLYVNPVLSESNEVDGALVKLIYSSLFDYDSQGKIRLSLAERYDLSEDKKVYTVYLKKGVHWHDKQELTAQDVAFTIKIIKDPSYKSPLRQGWQGVETEVKDDYTIKFILKKPYFNFLDNLTIGILPQHIWENVPPEKFSLAKYNLEPIGSGPYRFQDMQKDADGNILTYHLESFKNFFQKQAYITNFEFNFYPDQESLLEAYRKKEIQGMGNILPEKINDLKKSKFTTVYNIAIPHYFTVFFNQSKSVALAYEEVRKALNYAVNRDEIIKKVLYGEGRPICQLSIEGENQNCPFDLEKANKLLDEKGWKRGDGGIRAKDGTVLEFELVTFDWPELKQISEILAQEWKQIGVRVKLKVVNVSELQQNYIRPRNYMALLFGQATTFNPDYYPYWHSSFRKDPGLNFALFKNEEADKLLEKSREENDEEKRKEDYIKLNKIIAEKNPAVFLYSPYYLYVMNTKVHGVNIKEINALSYRFADVNQWYIKTKRILKLH